MNVKQILNMGEELMGMVPGEAQIMNAIKLADQAWNLVATLIKDGQDVLDPAELQNVHSALTDAIGNRKAQQAITDVALAKAAALGSQSQANIMSQESTQEVPVDMTKDTPATTPAPASNQPGSQPQNTGTASTVNTDKKK